MHPHHRHQGQARDDGRRDQDCAQPDPERAAHQVQQGPQVLERRHDDGEPRFGRWSGADCLVRYLLRLQRLLMKIEIFDSAVIL